MRKTRCKAIKLACQKVVVFHGRETWINATPAEVRRIRRRRQAADCTKAVLSGRDLDKALAQAWVEARR